MKESPKLKIYCVSFYEDYTFIVAESVEDAREKAKPFLDFILFEDHIYGEEALSIYPIEEDNLDFSNLKDYDIVITKKGDTNA